MGAGVKVAEAYVDIGISAAAGEAELDRLMAKADRDFAELGRKSATAELNIKSADFDAKIDDAKKQLDYLKGRRATATLDLAKKHFDEEIAAAKAQLKKLSSEKATVTVDTKQLTAANKAMKLLSDARALDEKHSLAQAKAEEKLSKARATGYSDMLKQRVELGRLSDEYERLKGKQTEMEKASRSVFSSGSIAAVEKEREKIGRVGDELALTKHKIEELGGSVEGLDARMGKNSSMLDRWASRLGDTSVRIGPLTTSIKGLTTGLALLGPLVFELGGGAADLIGFLGEGMAGAAAVGSAGLAGFATSALGVGLIIKPMIKEFGEVKASSEALGKAQLKYGKDSKQAKTAQEQLDHELKGVSPIAKEAFQNYGRLGSEWKKLTAAARPAVFTAFGESLKTVQSLLPEFASESVKTTQVAGKAWDSWMKSLRSSGARKALGEIMSNFRASIPGIASGLGDIGATLGHIAAAASHFLPGLSHGFAEWASNLEDSVGSGHDLQSTIGGLVQKMRTFGHLSQDTGSFLIHFFAAASGGGEELATSLDGVVKGWDKWAQSREGEESLKSFFKESAEATKEFFTDLAGATKLLFEFSRATAPVANGLLTIITFIGNLIAEADKIAGIKTIFQALGGVLAGLFVVGKVQGYISAIQGVLIKLGVLGGVEDASTASIEANTAALEANSAAMADNSLAAGTDSAAKGLDGVATAGDDAALSLGGAGTEAAGLSALLVPGVLIPVGALAAVAVLAATSEELKTSFERAQEASKEASEEFQRASGRDVKAGENYNGLLNTQQTAINATAKAQNKLAKLYTEGASPKKQAAALKELTAAEGAQAKTEVQSYQGRVKSVKAAEETLAATKKVVAAKREEVKQATVGTAITGGKFGARGNVSQSRDEATQKENLTKALHAEAAARQAVIAAQKRQEIANIPLLRDSKNLLPVTEATNNGLKKLAATIGVVATKHIASFIKPQDVAQVTSLSNKLASLGRGQQVKNIDVKSRGADQTIGKLKQLDKQTQKVEGARATVKVSANDSTATSRLKAVSALSQRLAGTKATVNILGNSANADQAITRLRAHLMSVIHAEYKAEITAADKTGPGFNTAKQHLRDAANTKAEAHITAVDQASSKARAASTALKGVPKTTSASINVTSNATTVAASAQAAMNAIQNVERTITITTKKNGAAAGGMFAVGGMPDSGVVARASERAEHQALKNSSYGAKIQKPTFLTGEEGATHPEYVIATNPAYKRSNEMYLEAAASEFGKEVVPAYVTGKGGKGKGTPKKSGSGKGGSSGGDSSGGPSKSELYDEALKNAPKKSAGKHHFFLHKEAFNPQGVHKINEEEANLQTEESEYSNLLASEEQRLKHKEGPTHWEFGSLKNLKQKAVATNKTIIEKLIPDVINFTRGEEEKAEKAYKELGPEIEAAREVTQNTKKEYTKASGKSTSKMTAKEKTAHSKEVAAKKAAYTEAKAYEKKKIEERKHAKKIEQEAKEEIAEVKHTRENTRIANKELGLEENELDFYQANPTETPYYTEPETPPERGHPHTEPAELALVEAENRGLKGAELTPYKQEVKKAAEEEFAYAKTTPGIADDLEAANEVRSAAQALEEANSPGGGAPTLGEQTATASAARQQLYEQFASNVTASAAKAITSAAVPSSNYFSTQAVASPAPAYLPGGPGATMFDTASSLNNLKLNAAHGTVNNVTNNFAAPPPDAHTFSKNLQFELNA